MSDITKCHGGVCQIRYNCWRYCAPSNPQGQSYSNFYKENNQCTYYWPIEPIYVEPEVRKTQTVGIQ